MTIDLQNLIAGGVGGGVLAVVASSAVRALPAPTPTGNPFYGWLYRFSNLILANVDKYRQGMATAGMAADSTVFVPVTTASSTTTTTTTVPTPTPALVSVPGILPATLPTTLPAALPFTVTPSSTPPSPPRLT